MTGRWHWEPDLEPPTPKPSIFANRGGIVHAPGQRVAEDPFRPASDILAMIEETLNAPDVVPPPVTLGSALATDPDGAWPCSDWCCTRGCAGMGHSLCRVASTGECHGRCTCGQQHIRDVVRHLQDVARPFVEAWSKPQLIVLPPEPRCTRPRWLPWWLHCRTCPRRDDA